MAKEHIGRIEALDACYNGWNMDAATIETITANIRRIPAADVVERKKGSWIEDGYYHEPCVCSYCGEPCKDTVMGKPRWIYCPMCGSKNQEDSP